MSSTHLKKGFTLIELLVVVSIISLLTSVVLASLTESRNKANIAAIETNSRSIQNEAEIYYSKNNKYIDSEENQTDTGCYQNFFETSITETTLEKIVALLKSSSEEVNLVCQVSPSDYAFAFNVANLNRGFTTYCISSNGNRFYQRKTVSNAIENSQCSTESDDAGTYDYEHYAGLPDGPIQGDGYFCEGTDRYVQVIDGVGFCYVCESGHLYDNDIGSCN